MAGVILRALPKRVFDLTNSLTSTTTMLVLAERIDISRYIDCMVALRVHSSNCAVGNSFNFDIYGDGHTDDDPGIHFQTAATLFSSQAITTQTAPVLLTYGGTVRGQYATLVVTGTKTAGGAMTATVSIDLVLRSPDEEA